MNFDVVATNAPVAVSRIKDGFGCPFNAIGAVTGNYNGTTEMECENGFEAVISCTVTNMA